MRLRLADGRVQNEAPTIRIANARVQKTLSPVPKLAWESLGMRLGNTEISASDATQTFGMCFTYCYYAFLNTEGGVKSTLIFETTRLRSTKIAKVSHMQRYW